MIQSEIEDSINRFIVEIREFSKLSDDEMRVLLRRIAVERPDIFMAMGMESQKKTFKEIKKMIKEITSR